MTITTPGFTAAASLKRTRTSYCCWSAPPIAAQIAPASDLSEFMVAAAVGAIAIRRTPLARGRQLWQSSLRVVHYGAPWYSLGAGLAAYRKGWYR